MFEGVNYLLTGFAIAFKPSVAGEAGVVGGFSSGSTAVVGVAGCEIEHACGFEAGATVFAFCLTGVLVFEVAGEDRNGEFTGGVANPEG
jgi:hypothetical protein